MRLVFLGSPPFATPVFRHLLASDFRPVLCVTPPARARGRGRKTKPSPVAELATDAGIPLLQPESVRDEPFLDELRAVEPDVFLVVSYGELLRQSFLDIPTTVSLNVHPSLLPRHRGATPIQAALLAGDRVTGVSIQKVVLELDAGDIVAARETEIQDGETAGELAERLAELSGPLCVEALAAVAADRAVYLPQDPERVTFCKRLTKDDGRIDWSRPAAELENHVRAMNPWPLARTARADGAPLSIHRARATERAGDGAPGTVTITAGGELLVTCGEGTLEVTVVQAAGKRAMPTADFLRGARLESGERLAGLPDVGGSGT